ncbi:MAG: hypothetical protein QOJ63_2806 [Solirubrobacteraceae bacterium]|jgi:hypothetical protein|nr:hypothetical protein [Solirubrobacteraceae bacterium]
MRGLRVRSERAHLSPVASPPRPPRPPLGATIREFVTLGAVVLLVAALLDGTIQVGRLAVVAAWAEAKDLATKDPIVLPVPEKGTRTMKRPLLIDIAVDESSSMGESDPGGRRWIDTATFGRWLARYQRADDLVAVTRFTDRAESGEILSTRALTRAPRNLAPDPAGDGTAFMPVVDEARKIFAGHKAAYRILILLTDGNSSDAGDAIAALPNVADRVFVVALDKGEAWDKARGAWESAGFPVTKLGNRQPNEIGRALASAVMEATGEKEK